MSDISSVLTNLGPVLSLKDGISEYYNFYIFTGTTLCPVFKKTLNIAWEFSPIPTQQLQQPGEVEVF